MTAASKNIGSEKIVLLAIFTSLVYIAVAADDDISVDCGEFGEIP